MNHGSATAYNDKGCRCDVCREGNRLRSREYYHRIRGGKVRKRRPQLVCGTRSAYVKGCRCADCTDANTAYQYQHKTGRSRALDLPPLDRTYHEDPIMKELLP